MTNNFDELDGSSNNLTESNGWGVSYFSFFSKEE
jgi:hypothetical protein